MEHSKTLNQICKLKEIYKSIYTFEREFQKRFSLKVNEAMVICMLNEECSSASSLADAVGLSPSRMSRVLSSLEKKEYITRESDKSDKRKWHFVLTEKGQNTIKTIKQANIDIPNFAF